MKNLMMTCAALAFGACAYAQDATPSAAPPSDTTPSSTVQAPASASVDFTGQKIYGSSGDLIGVVDGMTTDANGQHEAIVRVGRHMGIGADRVLFPANSLQPRDKGGYMTSLSKDQIEQLPKANATNTPAPQ